VSLIGIELSPGRLIGVKGGEHFCPWSTWAVGFTWSWVGTSLMGKGLYVSSEDNPPESSPSGRRW
jgi:hypothetical protein